LSDIKEMVSIISDTRPIPAQPQSQAQNKAYLENVSTLHGRLAVLSNFLIYYRLFICWYAVLCMVRFFEAFEAQPRLAIVSKTIYTSFYSIVHFLIVLFLIFITWASAGMFLFGHRLLEFSMLSSALAKSFLVMLGSADFEELSAEHPTTAAVWYWTYMLLVSLVMLNMALAIVLDVYTEVKADATQLDDILTQSLKVFHSLMYQRDWLTLSTIHAAVEKMPSSIQNIGTNTLMTSLPEIKSEQASQLISQAMVQEEAEDNKGLSMSNAVRMVGLVKIGVEKIAEKMEEILDLEEEEEVFLKRMSSLHPSDAQGKNAKLVQVSQSRMNKVAINKRVAAMEQRMQNVETMIHQCVGASVYSYRDMREQLASIEELIGIPQNSTEGDGSREGTGPQNQSCVIVNQDFASTACALRCAS